MPQTQAQYRVVIYHAIADPQGAKEAVARATGMHPMDVVQWLARAPGIWPRLVGKEVATRLLDSLYELGIAAEAWRIDRFPDLSPARSVHRAACLGDGLRIEGLHGEATHWIPWDRIELICAGKIKHDDEFRDVKTPRWPSTVVSGLRAIALMKPRPNVRAARANRIPRDPLGEVVMIRRDPRIAFRIGEAQMNYAYLKERLRESAAENFPLLLHDLCTHSVQAYITESTRALLEGGDPADYEFSSSQELFEHATLGLLWSWYRRDRDAQPPEQREQWRGLDREPPTDDQPIEERPDD